MSGDEDPRLDAGVDENVDAHDVAIPRETKSWAWVNERPCPECGFDASSTEAHEVPTILRSNLDAWSGFLATDHGADHHAADLDRLTARPRPQTWSPLEYACHVRDVLELLAYRLERTLAEDHPEFEDWNPNDRAELGRYGDERDPRAVLDAIAERSAHVIGLASSMTDAGWQRSGTRADGLVFTNAWLATYLTHDVVHHAHDVERILGRA